MGNETILHFCSTKKFFLKNVHLHANFSKKKLFHKFFFKKSFVIQFFNKKRLQIIWRVLTFSWDQFGIHGQINIHLCNKNDKKKMELTAYKHCKCVIRFYLFLCETLFIWVNQKHTFIRYPSNCIKNFTQLKNKRDQREKQPIGIETNKT